MKAFILLVLVGTLYAAPIDKTIDELLDNEKKTALKIPVYDPFKRAQPLLKKKAKKHVMRSTLPMQLSAIMNSKAFFAGKWYKEGDISPEGRVVKISKNAVYLRQGKKTKILRLHNKKSMFETHEKGAK